MVKKMKKAKTKSGENIRIGHKACLKLDRKLVGFLLEEAISKIVIPENVDLIKTEVDLTRNLAEEDKTKTNKISLKEEAFFAKRKGKDVYSRVIPNVIKKTSSIVTIFAFRDTKRNIEDFVLITAYIGNMGEKEPMDRNIKSDAELEKSLDYWCETAFHYDKKTMSEIRIASWEEIISEE
jgi:hypothetical protein